MPKLALALAALAVALSGWAAWRSRPPASAGSAAAGGTDAGESLREARTVARREVDARLAEILTGDVDKRIARLEQIRKGIEAQVAEARRLAEASADAVAARVDQVERDGKLAVRAVREEMDGLRTALGELQRRPAPAGPAPGPEPSPGPTPPPGPTPAPGPAGPTPPAEPSGPGPEAQAQVAKAMAALESTDVATVFAGIETLRSLKAVAAAPRLARILAEHKDSFVRMAAATALGGLGLADSVEALVEALVDDDATVATQASKSLRQITGFDIDLSAKAGIRERRKARTDMKQWWKEHEQEVRDRLGQPKTSPSSDGP